MYHFTKLAIEMNEEDDSVAPTDSRRRPDQRLMEHGDWDAANAKKNELEERQRRKLRKQKERDDENASESGIANDDLLKQYPNPHERLPGESHPEYTPQWFKQERDE